MSTEMKRNGCAHPDCDGKCEGPMFIAPRCHPNAQVTICYADGIVGVMCGECGKGVVGIGVAEHPVIGNQQGGRYERFPAEFKQ